MKNKKGFTLIELLAVIVILAIIMVIAVPQILNVINSSRESAWTSNCKLVDEAITLNSTLGSTEFANWDLSSTCTSATLTELTAAQYTAFKNIADISTNDTVIKCQKNTNDYTVVVTPKAGGQFANVPDGVKTCTYTYAK